MDARLTVHTHTQSGQVAEPAERAARQVELRRQTSVVQHWSSCEGEPYATNMGAAEVMTIKSLAADAGITVDSVLRTDASAALGGRREGSSTGVASERRDTWTHTSCGCRHAMERQRRGERRSKTDEERKISGAREAKSRTGVHRRNTTRKGSRG